MSKSCFNSRVCSQSTLIFYRSFSSVIVWLLSLFGRLPLLYCRNSGALPPRICIELWNSLSRIIERLYFFSVRISVNSSENYTKSWVLVRHPVRSFQYFRHRGPRFPYWNQFWCFLSTSFFVFSFKLLVKTLCLLS